MKTRTEYFGTKRLKAVPMTRLEYNNYRGWKMPHDEDPLDAGYLVEYIDGGPANDTRHEGYISWSPKAVFEGHYQPVAAMSFSHALVALKSAHRVARAGWNGKGMWLSLVWPDSYDVAVSAFGVDCTERGLSLLPWIGMRTADRSFVPWLASQTDMLADDYMIIEGTAA